MVITRKILGPTLGVFALVLLGLGIFFVIDYTRTVNQEAVTRLDILEKSFQSRLDSMEALASGLANSTANNPAIQLAFANNDRAELISLIRPTYRYLAPRYDLSVLQFVRPPARIFLRLDEPGRQGEDLSNLRPMLAAANALHIEYAGLELGPDGLSIRGIAPLQAETGSGEETPSSPTNIATAGSVEIGLRVSDDLLSTLKSEYNADWHILLRSDLAETFGLSYLLRPGPAVSDPDSGAVSQLMLLAGTMANPVFADPATYQQALAGKRSDSRFQSEGRRYAVRSLPLYDFSSNVIGVVDIWTDQTEAVSGLTDRLWLGLGVLIAGMFVGGVILSYVTRRVLQPIQPLSESAAAVARGEFSSHADLERSISIGAATVSAASTYPQPLRSSRERWIQGRGVRESGRRARTPDELEQLTESFNLMTGQLRALVLNLEDQVIERTRQLERRSLQLQAAADVARDVAMLAGAEQTSASEQSGNGTGHRSALSQLLNQAVQRIRERFNFYHVSLFLLDENGEYAILHAATGEAGYQLLQQGYRLRVGQAGIVGATTRAGRPHVARDVGDDAVYLRNPLLPDTRSEAALPLRIGDEVIGALDVQSRIPEAFDEDDITVLQAMADQLAIAINNARLIQQLNQTVSELQKAYGEYTQEAWRTYVLQGMLARRRPAGYKAAHSQVANELLPASLDSLPEDALAALEYGRTVVRQPPESSMISAASATESAASAGDISPPPALAVPIQIRGQTIGVVNLEFEGSQLPADMVGLVEEVTVRLGLVLESARLLGQAQNLAQREQLINWISTQVRESTRLETIMQNTVRSLGQALGATRTSIRMGIADEPQPGQME